MPNKFHQTQSITPDSIDLPVPDQEARLHCEQVTTHIRKKIEEIGGKISFAKYMDLALYAPGLGYYCAGLQKFGEKGDFITAPEISPLFSRCLANQCQQVLSTLNAPQILEFGAGSGIMAADILCELEQLNCLPEHYLILELSAELQQRQHQTIKKHVPHLLERVRWIHHWPEKPFNGVILANEVLDAMPVRRIQWQGDAIIERMVCWQDGFTWCDGDDINPEHLTFRHVTGYTSEYNEALDSWIKQAGDSLQNGMILAIDYGYNRQEYYHPQRSDGTLRCHYQHHAHNNPLILPGLQDITAHVDFTAVAQAAIAADLSVAGYTSQAFFLLANGLTERAEANYPETVPAQLQLAQQIKKLTMPDAMGETFKVIALTRNIDIPLTGFMMQDYRGRL